MNSAIYAGRVRHRRYQPKRHQFAYPMYMLALDLDELDVIQENSRYFSCHKMAPLRFCRQDYLGDHDRELKWSVLNEIDRQGGDISQLNRVVMVGQVRCFGFYFSPVNFFFCYRGDQPCYVLAEVRNTPWNQRHCYVVDLAVQADTKKQFHVSPFMSMNMDYRWMVNNPGRHLKIHIENWQTELFFDATLFLSRRPLLDSQLKKLLWQWPLMSVTMLRRIYWQAFRLLMKRIPYYSPPRT